MFKLILLLLPIISFANECPKMDKVKDFTISERVISIGTNFTLEDDKGELGRIEEKIISLTRAFLIYNKKNELVARGKKRMISWGSVVDVFDCNDKKIGSIEEKVVESLFSIKTKYRITDSMDRELASSDMLSLDVSRLEVKERNKTLLKMKRGFIQMFGDKWKVSVTSDTNIDQSLILLIPAFKTASDNSRRK